MRDFDFFAVEDVARTIIQPFQRFFRREAIGGFLLVLASIVGLWFANSSFADFYYKLLHTPITISIGSLTLSKDVLHWINEGLMVFFFFLVGLEIKREFLVGELSRWKQATLPVFAALGGMVVPALVYVAFNLGGPGESGWGVPMATDIAFALACLSLLSGRIPIGLVVFLTALAIVDDIGGILVIALFYTDSISTWALVAGVGMLLLSFILNRIGIRSTYPYAIIGVFLWLFFLKSGIHATVAGFLMALTIPASTTIGHTEFVRRIKEQLCYLTGEKEDMNYCPVELEEERKQSIIQSLEKTCFEAEAPLDHLEHNLHPWVGYFIIPLFAFANAGVEIDIAGFSSAINNEVFWGIMAGLVVGKQVGILGFSFIAVRLGLGALPKGVTWKTLYGAACLGGIGFTISLFISTLAFEDPALLQVAKLSIFSASLISMVMGIAVLWTFSEKREKK